MDFLKSQFDRLHRQLNGLSASQKMLTAALVTIMVMTLFMWGRYAGQAEYGPLLDQSFTQEDVSRITTELTAKGIPHKMDGTRIMVPEDRRIEALAHLSYGQMLPRDFANGFDQVTKQISPWQSPDMTDKLWNRGKEQSLGAIISAFPNVKTAVVVIDAKAQRRIGNDIEPSATISIWMRGGQPANQQLVNAAADVVAGAQAGLTPARIKVNVEGIPRKTQSADGLGGVDGGSEVLQLVQANEKYLEDNITRLLFIPNLMVSVASDINIERKETDIQSFDNDKTVVKPLEEKESNIETIAGGSGAGEPGAQPNTAMDINTGNAAPGGNSSTDNETLVKNSVNVGYKKERVSTPAGIATPVSASVRIPRSYFVNILKAGKADAKDPDETAVNSFILQELPKFKAAVKGVANWKSDAAISVETYFDLTAPPLSSLPETASASTVSLLMGSHTKEIALGALAAISLFMVSMMVRKSAPIPMPVAAPAVAASSQNPFGGAETFIGEVGPGDPMLDGMELDDESVKAQQMLNQVGNMVNESPDAAAALVKRWMNRN